MSLLRSIHPRNWYRPYFATMAVTSSRIGCPGPTGRRCHTQAACPGGDSHDIIRETKLEARILKANADEAQVMNSCSCLTSVDVERRKHDGLCCKISSLEMNRDRGKHTTEIPDQYIYQDTSDEKQQQPHKCETKLRKTLHQSHSRS